MKKTDKKPRRINFILTLLFVISFPQIARAVTDQGYSGSSNCMLQNTFPGPSFYKYDPSHFGASRSGGSRWHAGVDFFYEKGTKVSVPQGCQIRLYSDGTVIWKSDPTGYGQYMFIDCTLGGVPITLRYAHIAQYISSEAAIQQGRTGIEDAGIPDHYHFEVLISQSAGKGTPVDPECVLGITKGSGPNSPIAECQGCPTPPGPVNFCENPDAVAALISHSQKCYQGADKNNPGGEVVDPNRLRGVDNQGDPGSAVGTETGSGTHDEEHEYVEPTDSDAFHGDVDSLYPPLEEDPPIQPPLPNVPGVPGGDPNLAPTPEVSPEKLSGCAADTWTAMVNQAVMETRREDLLNKRFIVKPDSVLDYSCFSEQYRAIAENAGPIFSESNKWDELNVDIYSGTPVKIQLHELEEDNDPFFSEKNYEFFREVQQSDGATTTYELLTPQSLDMALDQTVAKVAKAYIDNNFRYGSQTYLAGSAPVSGISTSNCNVMDAVWNAAKCKNFDSSDVFYTFEDLSSTDPREFPASMSCF